ncbi:MAG: hypothetical protein AAF182_04765, partial [Pseudomonadota bacterium]
MAGVLLKGLQLLWKGKWLIGGSALAADHFYNDGRGREFVYEEAVKPTANAAFEKASEIAEEGLDKATDGALDGIKGLFDKIGLGPVLGFGAGALFSGGGMLRRMIVGTIVAGAVYAIQHFLLKKNFNEAAVNTGPDHTLEANANPNRSAVASEFQEKGS